MSVWQLLGMIAFAAMILVCLLDTDLKRKLLRPQGGRNP